MRAGGKFNILLLMFIGYFVLPADASGGWTRQRNGTSDDKGLPGIAAGDGAHAYAAGVIDNMGNASAAIFFTSNSGATWTMTNPDTRMFAMFFSAWAPSAQKCYVGGMSKLFVTENGGMSWSESQHPDMVGLKPLLGVGGFGDNFVVATAANEIFISHDSAATWTPVSSPLGDAGLTHVFFVDETNGWISSGAAEYDEEGNLTGYSGGGLIGTFDGGLSWNILKSPEAKAYGKPHFINPIEGWIVSTGMSEVSLERTMDGGHTWQVMALPAFSGGNLNSLSQVYFFDRCEGFLLGGDRDSKSTALFYTTDGGETWIEQDTSWAKVEFPPEFPFPFTVYSQLFAMDFSSRETGWIVGNYEFIGFYQADGPGPECGTSVDTADMSGWEPSSDAGSDGGPAVDGDSGCGCSFVK